MTQDAQGALRRIMETYAKITRFCLVCNYVTRYVFHSSVCVQRSKYFDTRRIIEPLASRCSKFRFTPLDNSSSSSRLSHIASEEHIDVNSAVVETLIDVSSGDLRRAITYLQSAHRLSSSTDPPTPILPRDIQEIAGVVPDDVMKGLLATIGVESMSMDADSGSNTSKPSFDSIRNKVKEVIREGYSASQILSQVRCSKPRSGYVY